MIFLIFSLLPLAALSQTSPIENADAFIYISPDVEIYGELKISSTRNLATIYVSSDVILVGSSAISNSIIVIQDDIKKVEKSSISSCENLVKLNAVVASEKNPDKTLQKVHKDLVEKINLTFYTSTEDENAPKISKTKSSVCIFSPTYQFSKFANS